MGQWVAANLSDILTPTLAWLAQETGLDASCVYVTCLPPEQTPRFDAPQDVLVRPMNEEPDAAKIDGAGRYDNRRTRTLEVSARTRLHLDQAGRDGYRMTDESLGHLALEDRIADALELYYPSDGEDALCAPFRVGRLTAAARLRDDAFWVYSTFTVSVEYIRDLDTARLGGDS